MGADHAERRLVAILAVDIVGYSRLVETDEAGTLAAIRALRADVFDPLLTEYHGRIVKLMGDGAIAEFGSVVDAVSCAVAIQKALTARQTGTAPERRLLFRMGINLGDVVVEGDDLMGDGVNVAARLEQICEPGGVFVSGTAFDHLQGTIDLPLQFIGEQRVKNIARPVRVYRIKFGGQAEVRQSGTGSLSRWAVGTGIAALLVAGIAAAWLEPWKPEVEAASVDRMAFPLPEKPSIAVLPFDNLSSDARQVYFADGMTDDLITELSKLSGIFVISRNSTFAYKGKPARVQQVAEDLGVRYVLEGSVRREGNQVRVNAQLIDAVGGQHLWAERYDGELSGVFGLQDKVVRQIVATLAVKLTNSEQVATSLPETTNPKAYDLLLQGWDHLHQDSDAGMVMAAALFQKAIVLDPDYSRAYASLAAANWRISFAPWLSCTGPSWVNTYESLNRNLAKAMRKPTALAYAISAEFLARQGRYDEASAAIDRAMKLTPNDPQNLVSMARILNATGHAAEAEEKVRLAMRYDPRFSPATLRMLAISLFSQGKYNEAVDTYERLMEKRTDVLADFATLISSYGHLGRADRIQPLIDKYNKLAVSYLSEKLTVQESAFDWYGGMFNYHRPYVARMLEGLRKAGLPEGAGTTLALDDYVRFMTMNNGEASVDGTIKIDAAEAKTLLARGVSFIDVRAPVCFENGHLPGAINLSLLSALSEESLAKVAGKQAEVAFYCGNHCPYSAYAAAKAIAWGYTHLFHFVGGFPEWQEAGYPVVVEIKK